MDRKYERIDRDAAGVGPYAREREGLVPLSTLKNWDISRGDADVRGWDVRTVSGRQLGTVRDLLVDKDQHEVAMLDIDVPGENRHAFVPIRNVQVDRVARVILMDSSDFDAAAAGVSEAAVETAREREISDETRRPREGPAEETVVDRRPVVEETVVRRYDAAAPHDDRETRDARMGDPTDADAERRRSERRRIDRMGTDL